MKLASDRLENNMEIKRLNKGRLCGVAHTRKEHMDPAKPFHVHENRNSSKELSSDRQREGNCKKWGESRKRCEAGENQTKGTGREE